MKVKELVAELLRGCNGDEEVLVRNEAGDDCVYFLVAVEVNAWRGEGTSEWDKNAVLAYYPSTANRLWVRPVLEEDES